MKTQPSLSLNGTATCSWTLAFERFPSFHAPNTFRPNFQPHPITEQVEHTFQWLRLPQNRSITCCRNFPAYANRHWEACWIRWAQHKGWNRWGEDRRGCRRDRGWVIWAWQRGGIDGTEHAESWASSWGWSVYRVTQTCQLSWRRSDMPHSGCWGLLWGKEYKQMSIPWGDFQYLKIPLWEATDSMPALLHHHIGV